MPKGARDLWSEAKLPNAGSEHATTASLKIDLHYAHLQIWERWSWERFVRLAKFLQLTLPELASIACIPHDQLPRFEERNRIMQSHAPNRAAALVLTVLEHHVCKDFTKDTVENSFPNLSADAPPGDS